ncbi:hypothetical protein Dimus_036009 [Dionaea muscipula]
MASILGIPETMESREYVKDVWEESKYIKPLEITRSSKIWEKRYNKLHGFDLHGSSVPSVNKKGEEPKTYDYFEETFLTMCKPRREDGVWWIGSGENEEEMMMLMHKKERQKRKKEGIRVILIGKQ